MNNPSFHKITPRAIRIWQWSGAFGNLFFFILPVGYALIFGLSGLHRWIAGGITLLILAYWIFAVFVYPFLTWKNWRYAIDEQEIDLKRGVVFKKRTLIPLSRVQHVDTREGPLLRSYNLSTVTISTAATTHEIPALDNVIADRVRHQISTFARLAEEDV